MKNLKKVFALVLSMALLVSTFTVSFAAEANNLDQATKLNSMGLFNGISTTEFNPGLELATNRIQAFVIIGRELNWDLTKIKADAADYYFTDVKGEEAMKMAQYAYENGYTKGIGENKFGPDDSVTARQLYSWYYRALGFEGAVYDNLVLLATNGLVSIDTVSAIIADAAGAKKALIRDDLVGVMFDALTWSAKDSKTTLVADLVAAGKVDAAKAEAAGVYTVPATVAEVESVNATNLREVVVVFNTAVDKDTAEAKGNYNLNPSKTIDSAKLQADGKTVVLTMQGELANQTNYKLSVKNVKDTAKQVIAKAVVEFKAFDGEMPKVTEIVFTGPKSFKATFNEPIETINSDTKVTVKAGTSSVSVNSSYSLDATRRVLTVNLYSTLKDATDYTICIAGAKDYAGYANFAYEAVHTYAKVKDLPVATLADANQKVVKITFSNPVTGLTNLHFYHSFSSFTAMKISKDNKTWKTDELKSEYLDTIYVQFADTGAVGEHPLNVGAIEVNVLGKNKDSLKLVDAWGNELADQVLIASIEADREAPEVTSVEVKSKTSVEIKFSEAVKNADDTDNYVFLDDKGNKLADGVSGLKVADDKKSVVITTDNFAGKTVTLEINGLKDASLYENKMAKYSTALVFTDKEFIGPKKVVGAISGGKLKIVYVTYEEDVNDTALDIAKYQLRQPGADGFTYTALKGTTSFFGNNKTVRIELDSELTINSGTDKIVVGRVQDVAGNTMVGFASVQDINLTFDAPKVKTVTLVAKNKVEVQFDQELEDARPEDFEVIPNSTTGTAYATPAGMDHTKNSTGSLLTFTLAKDAQADAKNVLVKTISTLGSDDIKVTKNIFGDEIAPFAYISADGTIGEGKVIDKVAPSVVEIATDKKAITDGKDVVKVRFNEKIDLKSLGYTDITIEGRLVKTLTLEDAETTLVITLYDKDKETEAKLQNKTVKIAKVGDASTERNVTKDITVNID